MEAQQRAEELVRQWEQADSTPDLSFIEDENQPIETRKQRLYQSVRAHTQGIRQNAEALGQSVEAMVALGDSALPALRKALRSPLWMVRNNAALALGELKSPEATTLLLEAYQTEKHSVVESCLSYALAQRDDPRIASAFLATLQRAAEELPEKREALQAKFQGGTLSKLKLMAEVVSGGGIPGPSLPLSEIEALARWQVREAAPFLLVLLQRGSSMPSLQKKLVEALEMLGDPTALPC